MTRHTSLRTKPQGFTLIEILVVLAIVGIISSITLGGFKEMRNGNKRVSCQTNLTQIYQAARLYAADEDGRFPAYSNPCSSDPASISQAGTGLWKLYTFPGNNPNMVSSSAPIERYLRSSKVLHCPSHLTHQTLLAPGTSLIDQDFLSYQTCDGNVATYATSRSTNSADANWKRQLIHIDAGNTVPRQPTGDTVVTWCQFHRGERGMDNVLFYDGTVQLIPQNQGGVTGWQRTPKPPV